MRGKIQSADITKVVIRFLFCVSGIFSFLSVALCVGYNLMLEHYIGLMETPQAEADPPFSATEILDHPPCSDLPKEPPVDDVGLPIITDTVSVKNILLIGTDARNPGEPCRSDAMILVSVNKDTQRIVACSLLRDILVSIDGHAESRLNSAYSFGGTDLLLDTLNRNFNIDVSSYILVDFTAFAETVDLLGGVDLYVTASEIKVMNGLILQQNSHHVSGATVPILPVRDGTYHLNGRQTLAYARDRSSFNGDFDRTGRQRMVLSALFQKLNQTSVFELFNLMTEILPHITTNIPESEIKAMVSEIPSYLNYDLVLTGLPKSKTFSFTTVREMSVIKIDFEQNIRSLAEQIYS